MKLLLILKICCKSFKVNWTQNILPKYKINQYSVSNDLPSLLIVTVCAVIVEISSNLETDMKPLPVLGQFLFSACLTPMVVKGANLA